MLHIALGRFDEIGNQVVTPLQLHVYLRPCVVNLVAKPDKNIVSSDYIQDYQKQSRRNHQQNNQCNHSYTHIFSPSIIALSFPFHGFEIAVSFNTQTDYKTKQGLVNREQR